MERFEKNIRFWDFHPYTHVTRENLISFVVWSFWDSKGEGVIQKMRLEQLNRLNLLSTITAFGVNTIFTSAELEFAAKVFNNLTVVDKDDPEFGYHHEPMSAENAAARLQAALTEMLTLEFVSDESMMRSEVNVNL